MLASTPLRQTQGKLLSQRNITFASSKTKTIADLKCGITKGKKLDALKQVFYLTPQPLPVVLNDAKLLAQLSTTELKKMAKERKIPGYSKMKKPELVEQLSNAHP